MKKNEQFSAVYVEENTKWKEVPCSGNVNCPNCKTLLFITTISTNISPVVQAFCVKCKKYFKLYNKKGEEV